MTPMEKLVRPLDFEPNLYLEGQWKADTPFGPIRIVGKRSPYVIAPFCDQRPHPSLKATEAYANRCWRAKVLACLVDHADDGN